MASLMQAIRLARRRRARARRATALRLRGAAPRPAPGAPPPRVYCILQYTTTPARALACSLAYWIAVAGILAATVREAPAPAIVRADFGVSAAILVISFLGNLFGLFGGGVNRATKRALEGMRDVITNIGREIANFARDTAAVFATVWGILRKFWARVLLPLILRLDRYIDRIFKWLRDTFGPVIEALLWIRRKIMEFYDKWLAPIFDTIDVLRRILGIFSLFGLEWSRKLDAALAELQERLTLAIARVLGRLNEVIDVIDTITTRDRLFQRIAFLGTLERDLLYIWRAFNNGQSKPLTDEERRAAAAAGVYRSGEQVIEESRLYLRTGDGPNASSIAEWVRELDLRLSRVP